MRQMHLPGSAPHTVFQPGANPRPCWLRGACTALRRRNFGASLSGTQLWRTRWPHRRAMFLLTGLRRSASISTSVAADDFGGGVVRAVALQAKPQGHVCRQRMEQAFSNSRNPDGGRSIMCSGGTSGGRLKGLNPRVGLSAK